MIDKTKCTAVLYSTSELSTYLVEIHLNDTSFFISSDDKLTSFANIDLAKQAAVENGAVIGFLALDKTYEQVDFVNDFDGNAKNYKHELMPVSLI